MSTIIRPELSTKNKYYIEKHRYYELKHFCLQYPQWKRLYSEVSTIRAASRRITSNDHSDPTASIAEQRIKYRDCIDLVEATALRADPALSNYILKGVTESLTYTQLKYQCGIPCGKDMYYDRYRRFFWLLDRSRN